MSLAALAFAAGAALLQLQAALPSLAWAFPVPVLLLIRLRYKAVLLAAACAAGVRFEYDVESADGELRLPSKLLISWYRNAPDEDAGAAPTTAVHAGERWAFTVRLRRPHGLVNPHGFDYEAWLLERGIGATGYVRVRPEPRRLGVRNSFLDLVERSREAVRDRIN